MTAVQCEQRSLFLYSPVGGGHFHASRALEDAWRAAHPAFATQQVDYLQFMSSWERRLWPGLYHLALRHAPFLWRSYRRWTERPTEPLFIRDRVSHVGTDGFVSLLRATRPRLVVNTIGGAAALAGTARTRVGGAFLNALVVSGFRAHHHWARREADVFFVSSDEAKADLIRHRVAADRIHVFGIPIQPGLRPLEPTEKKRLRARLGLGQDPVLLVSSGATGAYRALPELLDVLSRLRRPIDVLVFTGAAVPGVQQSGQMRVRRLGFRHDFCDWMAASDLVVGKLGGHTAAEAFAMGIPIVVYEPIAGQEEENATWVVDHGAAVWPRTKAALASTIVDLLDAGSARSERMKRAARRLARPEAAQRIVSQLATELEAHS